VVSQMLEEALLNSARGLGGARATRRIFRFGQRLTGELVPTVPARFRGGPGSPSGRLVAVRLRPATGEGWIRLRASGLPGRRPIRTIPLSARQQPAPTPDSVDLREGSLVRCHDGYVGRLVGVTYDTHSGAVLDLVVRVRGNVAGAVSSSRQPLASLQRVAGHEVLLSPAWAVSTIRESGSLPFIGSRTILLLNASAEQVASGALVRTDAQLVADLLERWSENPALSAFPGQLDAVAHDGSVTLLGTLPTPRQRATAEQDAWHVDGVLAVRNEIQVRG
jgi:hypothetical protein